MNERVRETFQMATIPAPKKRSVWKKGVRVLGVSESFEKSDSKSVAVGVVMRGDFIIDGFGICRPTVGGLDATEELLKMFGRIQRDDIRVWLLGGCIISWFNVIDINQLYEETRTPIVCVTYNPSEGIEKYLREYFPDDWQARLEMSERSGPREQVKLDNGHEVFINCQGLAIEGAISLVNHFTIEGKVPEPVRVARILASSIHRDIKFK